MSGIETTGAIMATSVYSLTCVGEGGSTTRSVTVSVAGGPGGGVSGAVDSSLVNRHREGENFLYAFSGIDTTAGVPAATAEIAQNPGGCTFHYNLPGLSPGDYTLAITNNSGTSFRTSTNITVSGAGVIHDFSAARIVQVGPGRTFKHPNDVVGTVQSGDVVEIDAGVYNGPATIWSTSNLTLRGVGGRAHLVAPATISNGKAIWVTAGNNISVENIEFSDAAVPDLNGSGIRADGQDLVVCGSYFHDNQEGVLGGSGSVLVEYSEFAHNGNCDDPSGCAHNIYIASASRFTLRYSYSHHAHIGHTVKSRALENYILYNRIMDETDGDSSYIIDLPNGGLSYVIGNELQQGVNSDNATMLIYGEEGLVNPVKTLYVVNNTFVNDRTAGGTFVSIAGGGAATVQNNLFVGNGTTVSGVATQVSNLKISAASANFVNPGAFDYRPTATTPGIDQGTAPGVGGTFDLAPTFQYVHPTNREVRPVLNGIDIGAFEYSP